MQGRDLSKLQIRAEITLLLQKFTSIDEMSKEQQDKCLEKLKSINDRHYVIEMLAKELSRADYKKGQLISILLQTLGNLEQLKEVLWSYIKSPKISDEIKDLAGITLKNLGDDTDPDEFLNYLDNPKAIVDKETQKLLEVASINPEAQIDFLDFLFSLPVEEQENLINSLKDDYSSEYLINVIAPALETRYAPHLEDKFIEILGETRSVLAVPALKDIADHSKNDQKKKKAQKSLNLLKLAGVNTENENIRLENTKITKLSDIYECHTSIPDGMGNQAIIISRIRPNQDIIMMNVVVNDIHGVLDCFGFYGISKSDFKRIVERFQEKSTRFYTSAEYCKYLLIRAEKTNKEGCISIPYEYAAWKSLLDDISPLKIDFEKKSLEWVEQDLVNETKLLHKFPDFNHWFFEEEDHPVIGQTIIRLIDDVRSKKQYYTDNPDILLKNFDSEISQLTFLVFDDVMRKIYKNRLQNIAYLLDTQELSHFRNIAASLAWGINPENDFAPGEIPFFREIIKKSIIEGFLRYQYKIETETSEMVKTWNGKNKSEIPREEKTDLKDKGIEDIIDILSSN